ncbi:MAG: hypothetical protein ACK58T_12035, partial [Phycisphaerae bacterium]
ERVRGSPAGRSVRQRVRQFAGDALVGERAGVRVGGVDDARGVNAHPAHARALATERIARALAHPLAH